MMAQSIGCQQAMDAHYLMLDVHASPAEVVIDHVQIFVTGKTHLTMGSKHY